jgi:enoyl-CoA hydratase/carnithine racemase
MQKHFNLAVDADGIALITMDSPGRSMNVLGPDVESELAAIVDTIVADPGIRGAIITSGKPSFLAGYDLTEFLRSFGPRLTPVEVYEKFTGLGQLLRRIETCGKPFVAAINGLALGGGFEVCLACHYRVIADDPKAFVGLPEVKVGLLPGGGGTQRMPRLIGVTQSLPYLLEGGNIAAAEAKKLGLVHEVVPAGELINAAKRWLLGSPVAVQPWDQKGFACRAAWRLRAWAATQTFMGATALVAKKTLHNYPAPAAILSCVFEGTLLPIDKGLEVESKYFATLVTGAVARNLIRTMFVNKGHADKLSVRPAEVPKSKVTKLGVLGAGMMGAGVAYVSAMAGMDVILIDATLEQAEKGKAYAVRKAGTRRTRRVAARGAGGRHPRPHQADGRLCRARRRRTRDRGGVRKARDQGRCDGQDRSRHRERRRVRQQHLDAAHHRPGQGIAAAAELHRHPFLLAGREDAAGRDHRRQADERRDDRTRARLRGPAQEDADRRQRQPRLLHQPLLRHLHRRRREDAGRRHRPATDRKRGQARRHAGRSARGQRRSEPRARVQGHVAVTRGPGAEVQGAGELAGGEALRRRPASASAARAAPGYYDYPEGGRKVLWAGLPTNIRGSRSSPASTSSRRDCCTSRRSRRRAASKKASCAACTKLTWARSWAGVSRPTRGHAFVHRHDRSGQVRG